MVYTRNVQLNIENQIYYSAKGFILDTLTGDLLESYCINNETDWCMGGGVCKRNFNEISRLFLLRHFENFDRFRNNAHASCSYCCLKVMMVVMMMMVMMMVMMTMMIKA